MSTQSKADGGCQVAAGRGTRPHYIIRTGSAGAGRTGGRCAILALLLWVSPSSADELTVDIKRTSIEDLMKISVTTASRQQEDLQASAAAVFVLTQDDLRNAHVTSIPDALRLVPGVQVARVDGNKWAVSIRGFNSRTANKLLVLIDGRSIYDPLFAGVFWESRDLMLENIERIEVVRGPGGALWGANAVNGVINIITKNAADTQGTLVIAGAGSASSELDLRHGWQLAHDAYARIYAKGADRDSGYSTLATHDDARSARTGFRVDWNPSDRDKLMFKGDMFAGTFGESLGGSAYQDVGQQGQSLVARWTRDQGDGNHTRLQFWYDRFHLDNIDLGEDRDTYDLEFEHGLRAGDRHRLLWGLGFRRSCDTIRDGPVLAVSPSSRCDRLPNAFLQDEISAADRTVQVTLGAKVEHNDYSGTEWQPSARAAWTPDGTRTWWASVSRAVRSPSRLESDVVSPVVTGNPEFKAETLVAYEIGYRRRLSPRVWLDAAGFHNVYDDLLSIEGVQIENRLQGTTSGAELAARWQPVNDWQFDLAYTYLTLAIEAEPGSSDAARAALIEGGDPRHGAALRAAWTPRQAIRVDAALRYTDELPAVGVPSYLVADIGLTWTPHTGLTLSLAARDLFDSHHPEQAGATVTEVPPTYAIEIRWTPAP